MNDNILRSNTAAAHNRADFCTKMNAKLTQNLASINRNVKTVNN